MPIPIFEFTPNVILELDTLHDTNARLLAATAVLLPKTAMFEVFDCEGYKALLEVTARLLPKTAVFDKLVIVGP